MTHIGYKGGMPAIAVRHWRTNPDGVLDASEMLELHKAGKTARHRDVRCETLAGIFGCANIQGSGIDIVGTSWYGMFAPPKTPDDVIARLNKAVVSAVQSPDVREKFIVYGLIQRVRLGGKWANSKRRRCVMGAGDQGFRVRRRLTKADIFDQCR